MLQKNPCKDQDTAQEIYSPSQLVIITMTFDLQNTKKHIPVQLNNRYALCFY